MIQIPKHLQPVLWSSNVNKLEPEKDAPYIIHQILSYGRFEDIMWVFENYPKSKITDIFITRPYKDYRAARFNFVKNHLLNLKDWDLDERRYVENIPRDIR